jgi:hypothetical protein
MGIEIFREPPSREDLRRYELLLQCFRSEQMSFAQLDQLMKSDAGFRDYTRARLRPRDHHI